MKRGPYLELIAVLCGVFLVAFGASIMTFGLHSHLYRDDVGTNPAYFFEGPRTDLVLSGMIIAIIGSVIVSVSFTLMVLARKRKGV